MNGILAKKLGMTQLFTEQGECVPVTVLEAGPCVVVCHRTEDKEGYKAIQIGFGSKKEQRANKAEIGHLLSVEQKVRPATLAKEFYFSKKDNADQNLRLLIAQQLQHLLPNIAAISAQVAEQSHIDQAQLALQHLQFTLSLFKDWSKHLGDKWAMQIAAFKQHFGLSCGSAFEK